MSGEFVQGLFQAAQYLMEGSSAQRAANERKKALRARAQQIRQETAIDATASFNEAERASAAGFTRAAAGGGLGQSALNVLDDFDAGALFNMRAGIYLGETQAVNALREANAAKKEANNAMISAVFSAGGSILSGMGGENKKKATIGAPKGAGG